MPAGSAADSAFPFDSELMLDAKPMKGSKRVPILGIGPKGEAAIDLWCNSIEAQIVVVESTITIMTGRKTDRQCDPARMRGDDELLATLQQVNSWRRRGRRPHAARRQVAALPPGDQLIPLALIATTRRSSAAFASDSPLWTNRGRRAGPSEKLQCPISPVVTFSTASPSPLRLD